MAIQRFMDSLYLPKFIREVNVLKETKLEKNSQEALTFKSESKVVKYQKVKVPIEIEKIKEVPGPEKVVYKEVPKEIVKNEIVYVPLYSVEDGTVIQEKYMKPKTSKKDE